MNVRCNRCGDAADPLRICACGGLPEFNSPSTRIDARGLKRLLRERRASYEPLFSSGVWRLRELLPPIPGDCIVSLREGNVPVYASDAGARFARVEWLRYLHLGMNPTGSFKDLGMTVAISAARARGARAVVCASTGNTASSMAAYAARAGIAAFAIVPRGKVSAAKLAQMREYGAKLVEVDGTFDDAFAKLNDVDGAVLVNSVNAYRIEGQKCAALALLDELSWDVPDWVILPGGNLGNISAFAKGFREARELGLIDRLPRLALIRAKRGVSTEASAIAVADPKSRERAHAELLHFGGEELALDDAEIFEAKRAIGREGIGCEPASAASLAGAKALRASRVIADGDRVVCVLTGHVLKDARSYGDAA